MIWSAPLGRQAGDRGDEEGVAEDSRRGEDQPIAPVKTGYPQ